jgi:hypothetical protein
MTWEGANMAAGARLGKLHAIIVRSGVLAGSVMQRRCHLLNSC